MTLGAREKKHGASDIASLVKGWNTFLARTKLEPAVRGRACTSVRVISAPNLPSRFVLPLPVPPFSFFAAFPHSNLFFPLLHRLLVILLASSPMRNLRLTTSSA